MECGCEQESNSLELNIWRMRWCSLEQRICELYEEIRSSSLDDAEQLARLLLGLLDFGRKQFFFFYNGFINGRKESEAPCEFDLSVEASVTFFKPGASTSVEDADVGSARAMAFSLDPEQRTRMSNQARTQLVADTLHLSNPAVCPANPLPDDLAGVKTANMFFRMWLEEGIISCETSNLHTLPAFFSKATYQAGSEAGEEFWINRISSYRDLFGFLKDTLQLAHVLDATGEVGHNGFPLDWKPAAQALRDNKITKVTSEVLSLGYRLENSCEDIPSSIPCLLESDSGKINLNTVALEICDAYPPGYVLGVVLQQIGHDISAIETSWCQRRPSTKLNERIKVAQTLAAEALSLIQREDLSCQHDVAIVRFDTSHSVRIIPYANVYLPSIPHTAFGENRDFLVIAHEVAHHIFWKASVNRGGIAQPIFKQLVDEAEGWPIEGYEMRWLEEIFSDVFSCLVGGKVMHHVLSDFHYNLLPADKTTDNGLHPPPFVRDVVFDEILGLSLPSSEDKTTMIVTYDKQDKLRDALKKQSPADVSAEANGILAENNPTYADVESALRKTAKNIESFLDIPSGTRPWPNRAGAAGIAEFNSYVNSPIGGTAINFVRLEEFEWTTVMMGVADLIAVKPCETIPFNVWQYVLLAGGWNTEGPTYPIVSG